MIEPSFDEQIQTENGTRLISRAWFTPMVGVVMLLVGLVAGYFVRPVVSPLLSKATLTPTASPESETAGTSSGQPGLNDYVAAQTNHFLGDENAPVTIIEFSDFQ